MATETFPQPLKWLDRQFASGLPVGMLPFFLERLEGTIARLEHKTAEISEENLSEKVNGKWSVKQNIGHLAEMDEISIKRVDEIITGVTPMSSAIAELKHDYNVLPIYEVLKFFKERRTLKLKKFKSLNENDLQRSSLHPRLKVIMNPVDLASFTADHDDHHLVTINNLLKTLGI
jgi:hypothetical protein